jgi:lambda repressor-like predicted transcriptional regulator
MPQMSKVELYAAIRRDHRGGMSMRELERKHGVTWRTVRKTLDSSWPEPRKKLLPRATGLDRHKPVIEEILRADLDAPRKQRHTVTRIFHRLVEEHGADVSYGMVRYYVAAKMRATSRAQTLEALTRGGVPGCPLCRPDIDLGVLE